VNDTLDVPRLVGLARGVDGSSGGHAVVLFPSSEDVGGGTYVWLCDFLGGGLEEVAAVECWDGRRHFGYVMFVFDFQALFMPLANTCTCTELRLS
jgi:hypothetical protein